MGLLFSLNSNKIAKLLPILLFFITIPLKNNYNSISIILLVIISIINYKKFDLSVFKSFYPLFIFYGLIVASLLITSDFKNGVEYLVLYLPLILFPFIFSTLKLTSDDLKFVLKYYIYWLCVLILFSELTIISNILGDNESLYLLFRKDYSYKTLGSVIGIHPPYMVLLMSFPIFYMTSKYFDIGINRVLRIIILLLFLFYILHLSSRLPLVAIILISFYLIFKQLKKKYSLFKALSIVFALLIITSSILYNVRSTRYRFQELIGMKYANGVYIKSAPEKLYQWKAGIKANENFLLGNGIGDANSSIIESNYDNGLYKNARKKYNAHNQFIQTYVGLGLIGLLGLFYILYFFLIIRPNSEFKTVSFSFLLYLLIVFNTESYLERHHGLVFITFLMCLINKKTALRVLQ